MGSDFTFLTSTNPALGEANTKQMRAHVTRKNFEKRRERLEGTTATKSRGAAASSKASHTRHRQPELSDKLRLARHAKNPSPFSAIPTEPNYAAIYQCKLPALKIYQRRCSYSVM